jgi:hypothetical protein
MFEVGKLRKIQPILSSLTATPPTPGASTGDVNRNLVSSFFLNFPSSFINGKRAKDCRQRRFEGLPTSIKKVLLLQKSTEPQ